MKTTFITIFAALAMSVSMAQTTVPNGDFENWTDPYNIPAWDGLNYIGGIVNFHTFSQSDDAHTGNYAARIETISQPIIGILPGIAFTGNIEFDPTTYEYSFNLGIPVEGRPSALKGFFKYEPANGDSMAIVVGMFKWNEQQQNLDSIGGGLFFLWRHSGESSAAPSWRRVVGKGKRKWEAPRLIVLCRSNPEEAVLTSCKGSSTAGNSSTNYQNCHIFFVWDTALIRLPLSPWSLCDILAICLVLSV
jgi:hypothetical protein